MKKTDIQFGSKGYYSLIVKDSEGNLVEDKCTKTPVDNVVTYAGAYNALTKHTSNSRSNLFATYYAQMGTGTTEITRDATGLGSPSGPRSAGVASTRAGNEVDNLDGTSTLTLTRRLHFAVDAVVGTFSEVGVYDESSGGTLVAGQLLKDEFGNPTTVTIVSGEQLVVEYTIEWTIPNKSQLAGTGTVTDSALNEYTYEIWAMPYFMKYSPGETGEEVRYFRLGSRTLSAILDASAGAIAHGGFNISTSPTWSHDGAGTATYTYSTEVFSPSSFNGTFAFVIGPWETDNLGRNTIVDTENVLPSDSIDNGRYGYPAAVKFVDPVTKTSSDSFTLGYTVTISV